MSKSETDTFREAQLGRPLADNELEMVSGGNSRRHYFYRLTHRKVSSGRALLDQFMQSVLGAPGAKKG